ncbi:trypco2 family protein [Streptomyces sp. KS 21]|uniref:trypco2 family protein n=1 Tax=Streptomyces sp. KS 21 TaxID=2485150 RepID=UPI001064387E|nr:trypco2 family protein [Streptomyces sp. KS 21]TDU73484.1 hypothetical protein EDD91_0028 [Streptomyces sp. KS 21]
MSNVNGVGLADALDALRDELETAWFNSLGKAVRFEASQVTLTIQTVARVDKEGGGKIRWWLIEAGGSAKTGEENTQTMELTLVPGFFDKQGRRTTLAVGADQAAPGS